MTKWQYAHLLCGNYIQRLCSFTIRDKNIRTFQIAGQPDSLKKEKSGDFFEVLAQLGENEWELIEVTARTVKVGGVLYHQIIRENGFYFKRELPEVK